MKLWLVILMLYPNEMNTDRYIGPYASEEECARAAEGVVIRPREGAPQVAVYCDDGCGQLRIPFLNKMRKERLVPERKAEK